MTAQPTTPRDSLDDWNDRKVAAEPAKIGGARPGAGRPVGKRGPTSPRSISLPDSLWEKADALVASRGLPSRSALFVALLTRARA